MKRIAIIVKRGYLYTLALVLLAGYPASAMADTQEPVTDPISSVVEGSPSNEAPQSESTPGATAPEPTIIDSAESSQPAQPNQPAPAASGQSAETVVDTTVNTSNNVVSDATTGNSVVSSNTNAGSAQTGNADVSATVLNTVNSQLTTGDNKKVATFTKDILGDVKGDIVLYPLLLKAMLEAKAGDNPASSISATTNFDVNNTITLNALSGDATVSKNTNAGDATTGSAQAVANVVNILNSMIATQDSFIGTINIYGNLEGDILVAPDFIPQMLANNADSTASNAQVSQQDTTTIVNNIKTVAESGTSTVFGNTNGGDAVTGDALSNVVIFNVSGHEIIAKNSLLVFVNVLGKWVGMIVDAPPNATAAMIGNGVTTNAAYVPDLTINSQVNHGITNTIAVTAQSGDATVEYNTNAGNAVSGQARALANVANISGSQFGVSDWFGVLFINVFQNWYGSFGVDTAYGNIAKEEGRSGAAPIVFVPSAPEGGSRAEAGSRAGRTTTTLQTQSFGGSGTAQTLDIEEGATVLAQSTSKDVKAISSRNGPVEAVVRDGSEPYDYRLLIIAGSMLTIGLAVLGLRRMLHT